MHISLPNALMHFEDKIALKHFEDWYALKHQGDLNASFSSILGSKILKSIYKTKMH